MRVMYIGGLAREFGGRENGVKFRVPLDSPRIVQLEDGSTDLPDGLAHVLLGLAVYTAAPTEAPKPKRGKADADGGEG